MARGASALQACKPLRESGRAPANSSSCRSLSLQGHYQNLLADHQAGVGTSALSFALSRAFLEVWEGSSGLCGGWWGRGLVSTFGTCGKASNSRDGRGPFIPLMVNSRSFPSILPDTWFRLAGFDCVSSSHTGRPDAGAERGDTLVDAGVAAETQNPQPVCPHLTPKFSWAVVVRKR